MRTIGTVAPAEAGVIWATPVVELAGELEREAVTLRTVGKDGDRAELLEAVAKRVRAAVEEARKLEWMKLADYASVAGVAEDTARARCRRSLAAAGLARKDGADWLVHRDATLRPGRRAAETEDELEAQAA